MQALLLMIAIVAQTTTPLPADSYAQPSDELVLRSGPSDSHPGVLTVPAGTILRGSAESSAAYQRVYLASGFPIYLHGDYVEVDEEQHTAQVLGQRVNARLLPTTVGLLPVGRVGADSGQLVLLGVEGDWVRVLAPAELALWAPRAALTTVLGRDAEVLWARAWQARHDDRLARVARALTNDPSWLAQHDAELELRFEQRIDVTVLNDAQLSFRTRDLAALGRRLGEHKATRASWQQLVDGVAREQQRREALLVAQAAARATRVLTERNLAVEAKALALGLSYQGQGEAQRIRGAVSRLTSADSERPVFSITAGVLNFKLSAPNGVTDLASLEGRTVILEGRSLHLMNVDGLVLVIDRVIDSGS